MTIDTVNTFLVARQGDAVIVQNPRRRMTPDEALNCAAWLVALAEHDAQHAFDDVLKAIRNT